MPTSYQSPTRRDVEKPHTHSQTTESSLSKSVSTVATLLRQKGNEIFSVRPNQTIEAVVTELRDKRSARCLSQIKMGKWSGFCQSETSFDEWPTHRAKLCLKKPRI